MARRAELSPLAAFAANAAAERGIELYLLWSVATAQTSNTAVSGVLVARFLPPLLAAPFIYRLLARRSPRDVMLWAQLAKLPLLGLVLLAPQAGALGLISIVALAAASSVATFAFDVSFQTAIPSFAAEPRLAVVNSTVQLVRQSVNFGVPVLVGGTLAVLGGSALVIALIVVSALAAASVRFAPLKARHPAPTVPRQAATRTSADPDRPPNLLSPLWSVVGVAVAVNVGLAAMSTVLPAYTQVVAGERPEVYGVLSSAAAAGAAGGAAAFALYMSKLRLSLLLPGAIAVMATGTVTLSSGWLPAAVLGLALIGATAAVAMLAGNVVLQRALTGAELAAGMVTKSTAVRIAVLLGSLAAGVVADTATVPAALWLLTGVLAAASLLIAALLAKSSWPGAEAQKSESA